MTGTLDATRDAVSAAACWRRLDGRVKIHGPLVTPAVMDDVLAAKAGVAQHQAMAAASTADDPVLSGRGWKPKPPIDRRPVRA